jgi:arylsulfatase A-like enzyme
MLKTAGYATGCFGKWHLGQGKKTGAGAQGFDAVSNVFGRDKTNGIHDDPKDVADTTRNACEFITAHKGGPFFAYIAHHAIHSPHQSTQAARDHFQAKAAGKLHRSATYAACIAALDDGVGRLMKHLTDSGLADSTLVIFTSDNGATSESPQTPLRSGKAGYYEGGLRVPLLVRWPGKVAAGVKCEVPVTQLDLYPTFLAITGASAPKNQPLDGHSLLPLLAGHTDFPERALHWHYPGYWDGACEEDRDKIFRAKPVSVVRQGDWKLMLFHEEWQLDGGRAKLAQNHAIELYNLRDDLSEGHDLAATLPAKRDALLDELLSWLEQTRAPLPTQANPAYDPKKPFKSKKEKFSEK